MSRRRDYRHSSRRLAVFLLLVLFLVLLLVVVASARGDDPPPTYKGRTAEEWGLEAEALELELREVRGRLGWRERSLARMWRTLRRVRSSLRAAVQVPGTTGETKALLCIHGHEGPWNDAGAPYFGGLQMDVDFQRAYGRTFYEELGHAHRWPVYVQVAVGLAGVLKRGFSPWPVTRRLCGV